MFISNCHKNTNKKAPEKVRCLTGKTSDCAPFKYFLNDDR
ncbi:hypothetical protein K034_4042, partial [Acinetobacter baumannii 42057_3]